MIEDFARLIPASQMSRSGKAFYSGRLAFESQSDLYILGANPGGSPKDYPDETVDSHTKWVLQDSPQNWSAYRDESWGTSMAKPGSRGIQPSLLYLFDKLSVNPGKVPASNLVFPRSTEIATYYGSFNDAASECLQFHKTVIKQLSVRVVVHFGLSKHSWLCKQLNASQCGESFTDNGRRISITSQNADGLKVVSLVHPTPRRGYPWLERKVEDDPTESVIRALN